MKKITNWIVLGVLLVILALPTTAFAQGGAGDQVVFGGSYRLESGETLGGNLVVFGGSVDLEDESLVEGDILVFGGAINVAGEVAGNLIVVGGSIDLASTALVRGDLITPGSGLNRDEGAQILGQVITDVDIADGVFIPRVITPRIELPNIPDLPTVPEVTYRFNPLWNAVWFLFRVLAVSALSVLVIMFLPRQAKRTAKAVVAQPILSGGLGILTVIVAVPLFIVLLITIILIPVSLLGLLLLSIAALFGWIALGMEVGQRLAALFKTEWAPAVAAGIGTFALTLVTFSIDSIPCVGWLAPFFVTALGLGGVLLSRFGTQDYPPAMEVSGSVLKGPLPDPLGQDLIEAGELKDDSEGTEGESPAEE
jgi:hypothetical protein